MTHTTPRRAAGFTLIEVLVVLTIIGVVTAIGTSTFVVVTSAWHERRAISELDNQAEAALESIRADVASTLSFEISGVGLTGGSRRVADSRTYPPATYVDDDVCIPVDLFDAARQASAPGKVGYRVERDGATGTLVRTTGPLSGEFPTGGRLPMLTARVQGFSVEYLGAGAGAVWSEAWSGPGLPRAVRVSLAIEDPVRPEFQVARVAVFPIHVQ